MKLILLAAVMSEKVTVEGAFGPGGGGVFGNSPELYERPGRGVGVGPCAAALALQTITNAIAARNRARRPSFSIS